MSERENALAGYHSFGPEYDPTGSFEVFYDDGTRLDVTAWEGSCGHEKPMPGWYWWACFPGCIPDGEASGPFETSDAAFTDAQGNS